MTTVHTTFVYLDSADNSINDGSQISYMLGVKLAEPIPIPRHSMLFLTMHALNIPVANTPTTFLPFEIKVGCATPSNTQSSSDVSGTLLSIPVSQYIQYCPGVFSAISYRSNDNDGCGVQILDPALNYFQLILTDGLNNPYQPSYHYTITLKFEVKRNYEAEQVELLRQLLWGQRLLLHQQHLVNKIDAGIESSFNEAAQELYQPGDFDQGATD